MRIGTLATMIGVGGAAWYLLDSERRTGLQSTLASFQQGDTNRVVRDLREGATRMAEVARRRSAELAGQARGYADRLPASGDVVDRVRSTVGSRTADVADLGGRLGQTIRQTVGERLSTPTGRALASAVGGLIASRALRRPGLGSMLGMAGLAMLLEGVASRQASTSA